MADPLHIHIHLPSMEGLAVTLQEIQQCVADIQGSLGVITTGLESIAQDIQVLKAAAGAGGAVTQQQLDDLGTTLDTVRQQAAAAMTRSQQIDELTPNEATDEGSGE